MKQMIARGKPQLERAAVFIAQLPADQPWKIEVEAVRGRRTTSQNKLLWAIYTEIASETGHTSEEIHEFAKAKFLPRRTVEFKGEETVIPGSTAVLDRAAFSEYVERVAAWAGTEFGIVV